MWSKQAICAYVASEAMPLLKQGIRINAICPGPTDTPLAQANKEMWLGFGADYRAEVGVEAVDPARAGVPARVPVQRRGARRSTGITMITDAGYFSSGITESFPAATPIANLLLNR